MHRICHVTSVHNENDSRIFFKECISLSEKYDVTLVVVNAKDEVKEGVKIVGVTLPNSRVWRVLSLFKIRKKIIEVNADIYHFHDPELLPMGLVMKRLGKKVIFDSHEDIPVEIKEKQWIPFFLRFFISSIYQKYEKYALAKYDSVISVTPTIVERLRNINPNTYQITNYPILNNFVDERKFNNSICFFGLINENWMHHNVISALDRINVKYILAGPVNDSYFDKLKSMESWEKVDYFGVISFNKVYSQMQCSSTGIALYDYLPSFGYKMGSLGNNKIFEYMSAGIPIICTDFTLWKEIVEQHQCGICVNPHDINAIRDAIAYVTGNVSMAKVMGDNGRKAVETNYNWNTQKKILFKLYSSLVNI